MTTWHMAQVPPDRWAEFTALPRRDWIEMWTRSDLLGDLPADVWAGLERYPVQLHCSECPVTNTFVADCEGDGEPGDQNFTLTHLDERMAEFIEAHAGCPLQMRMAV